MKNYILLLISFFTFLSCQSQEKKEVAKNEPAAKIQKTDAEWKKELTPEQYEVLRKKGTERAFTGKYYNHFEKGKYVCAACGNVLFNSDAKFDSDCGWPSFDQAIKGSVIYKEDTSFGMTRTEVMCAKCGGHLGHVFDDGPKETTGKRFCTNSVSIKFEPAKK
ncbi:peptide-methionine (R)-S-oxide reductase [Flavobacterium endophyticum]|uniref:peptide-methionine (R)-S-oxide reductase n=1 Tax=Flavobacterium endophyticum TaxID=1540163 RepID=A0A495M5V5_9FLAO|nr:peptide-methionine (R)-S-oxide reductase MsrB [Flavobacterium endophyticum]RKS20570.1 peptide-methionine (R)-S-oxide reductase [Flavobacterium endophyticum]